MNMYDDIRQFLQKNKNPVRGIKEKAYLKTVLIPSLKTSKQDWALLCAFADDYVKPGSKFHKQYFALKGLSMTMRWAIGANKNELP